MGNLYDDAFLKSRLKKHLKASMNYVEAFNFEQLLELHVNPTSLYLSIKSAYDDIERYKIYHLNDPKVKLSNGVKRAAFITKWIMKSLPVQSSKTTNENIDLTTKSGLIFVNPALAIEISLTYLCEDLAEELKIGSSSIDESDIVLSDKALDELVYDLCYRELNGDALLAIYQLIYDRSLESANDRMAANRKFSSFEK